MARRLTTFSEFCLDKNLRPEVAAGFKVWLHGKPSASDEEWEKLYTQYTTRELGE